MKRILYTILTAAAVLLGNYFFSNGTLEATVETPTPITTPTLAEPSATSPASNGTQVSYMGTSFTIPFGLANGTQNEIVPQTSPNEPMLAVCRREYLVNWAYEPKIQKTRLRGDTESADRVGRSLASQPFGAFCGGYYLAT